MTCIVCEKPQGSCEFCAASGSNPLAQGDPGDECTCAFCKYEAKERLRLAGEALDVSRDLWPLFANDDLRRLIQDACKELERRGERELLVGKFPKPVDGNIAPLHD